MSTYYEKRYRQKSCPNPAPKKNRPWFAPRLPFDTGYATWNLLPAWEKRFCVEVGGMSWRRFVEAKKNLHPSDKVYDWNDSAGKQAFDDAKQRFWAKFHGVPCKKRLPNADMYIDKHIDWNPEIDAQLFSKLKSASDVDEEEKRQVVKEIDRFSIPVDQIKATGWDDDCYYAP